MLSTAVVSVSDETAVAVVSAVEVIFAVEAETVVSAILLYSLAVCVADSVVFKDEAAEVAEVCEAVVSEVIVAFVVD